MRTVLLTACWLLGIVYASIPAFWLVLHGFADRWRQQRRPYRFLVPAWLLIMAVMAAVTWPWRGNTFYDSPWPWAGAAVCFALAISIYHRIGRDKIFPNATVLGRTELEPQRWEQKLVTQGIHGRVRHPMYAAHLLMLIGWTVGSGLVVLYALLAVAIVSGTVMIRMEERELEARFGEAYRAYKQRVPAIIPAFEPREAPHAV